MSSMDFAKHFNPVDQQMIDSASVKWAGFSSRSWWRSSGSEKINS